MSEDSVQNVNVTNMALNVRVTTIDIPFRAILWLTAKFFLASFLLSLPFLYFLLVAFERANPPQF